MYELSRKLWFGVYAVAFVVLVTLSVSGAPTWLWCSWAAVYMLFVVLVDPAPRNVAATVRAGCDCTRCMALRTCHTRRSTDTKDVG